jgi:signal transduction histidine kinase
MLDRLQYLTNFYESTGSAAADRTLSEADALSLLNAFVESFAPQAEKRGIRLQFEGDGTLPIRKIAMHEAEFSSVLINLYTNAVKAIQRTNGRKRDILMRHSRVGNNEVVEVLDTGVGIVPKDRKNIFEPFFTTTPVKRALRPGDSDMFGTGLGLTIARDAIQSARGSIELVNPPPKGFSTCFRIELPHGQNEEKE